MIRLYGVNIVAELEPEEIEDLSNYLSPEKQARLKRFYHFKDLKRSLVADILVRWEICRSKNILNKELYFDTNPYGKPHLRGEIPFHFNVSHAGDWVVVACHDAPLGVDVEEKKPIEMGIAERFFSRNEYEDLLKVQESNQLDYFFQLWSLKESYIKAEGKGLSIPLDSFSFSINNEAISLTLHKEKNDKIYYFKMYDIDPKYRMALCTSDVEAIPREVQIIKLRDLYHSAIEIF